MHYNIAILHSNICPQWFRFPPIAELHTRHRLSWIAFSLGLDIKPCVLYMQLVAKVEIHDGKQRLSASNHFGFPCNRTRRVSNAHKRFRSPARNPSHVSESAMILRFGLPSRSFSTVIFPSRIITVASADSLPVKTRW